MNWDFDGAIFDMDGTLLNTMPYWRYTALEYVLHHQWRLHQDLIAKMPSTSARRLLPEYAKREGATLDRDAMVRELEGYMNRHYLYDAHLKEPAVTEFLEMLKSHGVRMCVATGSPREYARNGLERLGILQYFEFVTDNVEFGITKDRPGYFDAVLQKLGVAPARCWVFEDALYSMKSARQSGLRVCAIEDESQADEREAILAFADIYIKSYRELMVL